MNSRDDAHSNVTMGMRDFPVDRAEFSCCGEEHSGASCGGAQQSGDAPHEEKHLNPPHASRNTTTTSTHTIMAIKTITLIFLHSIAILRLLLFDLKVYAWFEICCVESTSWSIFLPLLRALSMFLTVSSLISSMCICASFILLAFGSLL